jgi:DNA-binding winged helix-turn-helix (wHTH) protein
MHFIQIGDWLFDSQAQQLIKDNETVQLEPISCDLLLCLVNHQSQIVSKDNLIAHVWKNRIVSDSAITRVISMLRKHLGDDPVKPTYIRTIQKQGYLLLAPVRELSEQESKNYQNKKIKSLNRLLTVQNISILILFGITVWLSIDNIIKSQQPEVNANQIKIEPVVTEKGQEAFVALSPNDEFIIYSHTVKNGGFYHLYQKELSSGKVLQLTQGAHNDLGASVGSRGKTVYFARLVPGKSCHIMELDLTLFEKTEPLPIVECSKSLGFSNVSAHPNMNDIFYIDLSNRQYVYRYNKETKEKIRVSNPNTSNVSDYYQKLSPDGEKLAFVRTDNGANQVVLKRLDNLDYEKVIWSSNGPYLHSISWSKDSNEIIFFEKRFNQFIYYNLESDDVTYSILNDNRLNSLTNQRGDGGVYAVLGNQTQYDISSISLTPEIAHQQKLLIASTANDKNAVQLNKTSTVYVSDRSGMFQFWLRERGGVDRQISEFNEHRAYFNLVTEPSGEVVVGQTDDRLFQFTVATAEFKWITDKHIRASFPVFDSDSKLYYIVKGKSSFLVEHNPNIEIKGTINSKPLIDDAVYAEFLDGNIVYQDGSGGIFLYNRSHDTTKLLINKSSSPFQLRNWISTSEGIYFTKIGNDTNRGLYFQRFEQSPPELVSSSEPNPFGGLSYDHFNHRILLETEEDIDTNIVKINFTNSETDGEL